MKFNTIFSRIIPSLGLLLVSFSLSTSLSAQVITGTNGYITYQPGDLPIVISVPHGGDIAPESIPDRTCNNPVYATDANTIELAQAIDSSFIALTGCRPHIIYCHLHRSKLDANRNLTAAACGNNEAVIAWNEFHDFIENAQSEALEQYEGKAFYIDLHGHGNSIQRLELGYLLYDDELDLDDEILNTQTFIDYSSIRSLVNTNVNNETHAELLRGPNALGTYFGLYGYPAVPGEQIPAPGTNTNYFSGGYNTVVHTSYQDDNPVSGVQIECNYTDVRDTEINRRAFADSLAIVMRDYLNYHLDIDFTNCADSLVNTKQHAPEALRIFPTIANAQQLFNLQGIDLSGQPFTIFGTSGIKIESGFVSAENTVRLLASYGPQFFILSIQGNDQIHRQRILMR